MNIYGCFISWPYIFFLAFCPRDPFIYYYFISRAILAEYSGAVLGVLSAVLYGRRGFVWKKVRFNLHVYSSASLYSFDAVIGSQRDEGFNLIYNLFLRFCSDIVSSLLLCHPHIYSR